MFLVFCIWGFLFGAPSQKIEPITQKAKELFEIETPKIFTYQDRRYKIFIAKNKSKRAKNQEKRKYKVLFLLDGNAFFSRYLNTYSKPPEQDILVVAIGYDENLAFNVAKRTKDYTPKVSGEEFQKGGGSLDFLNFLKTNLLPYIKEHYFVDTSHLGIFGHSFGGLFVLWSFLQENRLFSHYFIASPSLWWGEASFIPDEIKTTNCPKIFLLKGSKERRRSENPQTNLQYFAKRLEKEGTCKPNIKVFKNQTHGGVIDKVLNFTREKF